MISALVNGCIVFRESDEKLEDVSTNTMSQSVEKSAEHPNITDYINKKMLSIYTSM